ncbi:hypothetical protein RXV95_12070 [Novosphingobium sp. ZN18A2]|uniref:hypothetical protein n=1 Tax=Novosphingobium sp. ZN18A2 TaxID=3079861 RepID=UPI0030CA638A
MNKTGHSIDKTYNLQGAPKPATKRFADLDGPDFYPTPPWATFALVDNEKFDGEIWEPACGDGTMARVIEAAGHRVRATDLYDRGFGTTGIDFLKTDVEVDNIITNPPFNAAEGFVAKSLQLTRRKFALLLRLAFLEGANRQKTIFLKTPPTRVWVFSERITFYPANAEKRGSGTTAYAWFVWDKESIGSTELKWIPLGYKARYDHENRNPTLFR